MTNYFLQTLEHLRHYEEVMLYANLLEVSEPQQAEAVEYLTQEYKRESLSYPYEAPEFHPSAAAWAAQTLYTAAQLMLYREHKATDMEALLPVYDKEITAAAMLSADLTLRFLPHVIKHLKLIDMEDPLVGVLEDHLTIWHYSGVAHSLPLKELNFKPVTDNNCLQQLYIDRVIQHKKLPLANHPALIEGVRATLGIFASTYWNDFKQEAIIQNECKR